MEEPLSQEVLLRGEESMADGALIGLALGNAIADSTFRQIMGYKLLSDENRVNDGIGMALLMNNSTPVVPTLYRKTIKIKKENNRCITFTE